MLLQDPSIHVAVHFRIDSGYEWGKDYSPVGKKGGMLGVAKHHVLSK